MTSVVVADTSPLIGLGHIGKLDLLQKFYNPILIPPAVSKEFGQPVAFIDIRRPHNHDLIHSLSLMIGAGESEAIALALQEQATILLDDKKARRIAAEFGLPVLGTVGLLIKARQAGHIDLIGPFLTALEETSFYISADIKRKALHICNEK